MKKTNKLVSLGLAAIVSLGIITGCGAGEQDNATDNNDATAGEEKVTLKMGTSADYPPFEYIDTAKGSEIIGFDIDLATYIAEQLGFEYEITNMDFNGLVEAVRTERVDFVLSGMTPTDDRRENVDFSNIYYEGKQMVVTLADSGIDSLDDLNGKKVGAQLGSIQQEEAETIEGAIVEKRDKLPQLIQELKIGQIEAAVIEDKVAEGYLETNEDLAGFLMPVSDDAGYAVAFPKDSELTEQFNQVIAEMKENGKLDELINKWFGGQE